MDREPELLVVVNEDVPAGALRDLLAAGAATQMLLPRLVLIQPDQGAVERLRAMPGVRAVYRAGETPDPEVLGLDDEETFFVGAWQLRAQGKTRRGDGLAWDAPGLVPPDPPA